MPQLTVKWGGREYRFSLNDSGVDIGRADDNQLQIKDLKISRYQCKIIKTPLGFLLSDLESGNGTFLNGKRIDRTIIKDNDVIRVGSVSLVFSGAALAPANGAGQTAGRMVISSGNSMEDPSAGEVTTVINIQAEPEVDAPVPAQGIRSNGNGNGKGKGNGNGAPKAVPAEPPVLAAKIISRPAPNINGARPAENAMINNRPVNGTARSVARPQSVVRPQAPAPRMAPQPAVRPQASAPRMAPQPAVMPQASASRMAPQPAVRPQASASRMAPQPAVRPVTPPPMPVARLVPKPQSGFMSRLPPQAAAKPSLPPSPMPVARLVPKPQSGFMSRLPPQAAAKPSLPPSPPPPPRASSSGLMRGGMTPPKTSKVSKISKPGQASVNQEASEFPKPKKNKNLLYLIGAGAAVLLVIIIFVASAGSNKKAEEDKKRENESLQQAEKLYSEKDYKGALKQYEAFLDEFKMSKNSDAVRDRIKKIKERESREKEAKPKLAELKRKKDSYSTSQYPELLKEFEEFIKEHAGVSSVIMDEAKGERDAVKRIASSAQSGDISKRYNETLSEVERLRGKNDYDGALAKLKSFLKENSSLNDRQENALKNEIKAIEKEKSGKK